VFHETEKAELLTFEVVTPEMVFAGDVVKVRSAPAFVVEVATLELYPVLVDCTQNEYRVFCVRPVSVMLCVVA
jgi:hypothetical protein